MSFKSELKQARELLATDKSACLAACEALAAKYADTEDAREPPARAVLAATIGACALSLNDAAKAERAFRDACAAQPDLQAAWKGLADALELSGKIASLPEPLMHMAAIAESKGNEARGRALRLRAANATYATGDASSVLIGLRPCIDTAMTTASAAVTEADALDAPVVEEALQTLVLAFLAGGRELAAAAAAAADVADKGARKERKRRAEEIAAWRELGVQLVPKAAALGSLPSASLLADFEYTVLSSMYEELRKAPNVIDAGSQKTEMWQHIISASNALAAAPGPVAELPLARDASAFRLMASWWVADDNGSLDVEACFAEAQCAISAAAGVNTSASGPGAKSEHATSSAGAFQLQAASRCRTEAALRLAWQAYVAGSNGAAVTGLLSAAEESGAVTSFISDWRRICLLCFVEYNVRLQRGRSGLKAEDVAAAEAALAAAIEANGAPLDIKVLEGSLTLARAWSYAQQGLLQEAASALSFSADQELSHVSEGLCLHCQALCARAEIAVLSGRAIHSSGGGTGSSTYAGSAGRSQQQCEDEALALYQQVLDVSPAQFKALLQGGTLLLSMSKADRARSWLERAAAVTNVGPENAAEAALRLGQCYWELGGEYRSDRSRCFACLLRAAKLDAGSADAFARLGQWYAVQANDEERARGCLSRAVVMDPCHPSAGPALAAIYLRSGQEALALALFRRASEASSLAHWAWAGLGRSDMVNGQLTSAAALMQQALRGATERWDYWADLAWIYHSQSRQQAALKAYTRAATLLDALAAAATTPDATITSGQIRVLAGMGQAQREISLVDDAVSSLRAAMKAMDATDDSGAIAARDVVLHGATEALLAQAHARASEGLCMHAATCLFQGVQVANALVSKDGQFTLSKLDAAVAGGEALYSVAAKPFEGSVEPGTPATAAPTCTWKLLGDLHTYGHRLPESCFGSAAAQLEFVASGRFAYEKAVERIDADVSADSSRGGSARALALYDLGINLYGQARLLRLSEGEGSGPWPQEVYDALPRVSQLTAEAANAFREAVMADPACSDAWNGLGTALRDPLLRQHCYVRASQIDHHPAALANLAVLLLSYGLDEETYDTLGALQAAADHPLMWICLGMLKAREAEASAARASVDPKAAKKQRDFLLRQSADAAYAALETVQHPDALVNLAGTVWRIGGATGFADALSSLAQAVDLAPANAGLWNLRGCLLLRRALESHGFGSEGKGPAVDFRSSENGVVEEIVATGDAAEAVKSFRSAIKLLEHQRSALSKLAGDVAPSRGGASACDTAFAAANANLADAQLLTGDAKLAADAYRAALSAVAAGGAAAAAAAAGISARALSGLGRALAAMGLTAEAEAALLQADAFPAVEESVARSRLLLAIGSEKEVIVTAARGLAAASNKSAKPSQAMAALGPVMAAAAVANDPALATAASRELRARLHAQASADDAGMATLQRIRYCFALEATQRETGLAPRIARRALFKAVHQWPGAPQTWLTAASVLIDSASTAASSGSSLVDAASDAALARRCASAAALLVGHSLRGADRHSSAGSGSGAVDAEMSASAADSLPTFVARDYARALAVMAAADALLGRQPAWLDAKARSSSKGKKKGREKAEAAPKAAVLESELPRDDTTAQLRQLQRAVHMYPGETATWRLLALALLRRAIVTPVPPVHPAVSNQSFEGVDGSNAGAAAAGKRISGDHSDSSPAQFGNPDDGSHAEEGEDDEISAEGSASATLGTQLEDSEEANTGSGVLLANDPVADVHACAGIYRMVAAKSSSSRGGGSNGDCTANDAYMATFEVVYATLLLALLGGEGDSAAEEALVLLSPASSSPRSKGLEALSRARAAAAATEGNENSTNAIAAYEEAVAIAPNMGVAWSELSSLLERSGQPQAAETALRSGAQALREKSSSGASKEVGLLLQLAALFSRLSRHKEAGEAAEAAEAAAGVELGVAGPGLVHAACCLAAKKAKKATDVLKNLKVKAVDARAPALLRLSDAAAKAMASGGTGKASGSGAAAS